MGARGKRRAFSKRLWESPASSEIPKRTVGGCGSAFCFHSCPRAAAVAAASTGPRSGRLGGPPGGLSRSSDTIAARSARHPPDVGEAHGSSQPWASSRLSKLAPAYARSPEGRLSFPQDRREGPALPPLGQPRVPFGTLRRHAGGFFPSGRGAASVRPSPGRDALRARTSQLAVAQDRTMLRSARDGLRDPFPFLHGLPVGLLSLRAPAPRPGR